jgi:hypothetical protein
LSSSSFKSIFMISTADIVFPPKIKRKQLMYKEYENKMIFYYNYGAHLTRSKPLPSVLVLL